MTPTTKTRQPRSEEQKAAARERYLAQKQSLDAAAINRSTKFDDFIHKFLPWLMQSYDLVEREGLKAYKKHEKINYVFFGTSCYLELSITWLRGEYGPKAVDAFKRLFKQVQQGGRTKEGTSYSSIWVKNDEIYTQFRRLIISIFRNKGHVDPSDVWDVLESAQIYKRAATKHVISLNEKGYARVKGLTETKAFHPIEIFDRVRMNREAMNQTAKEMNAKLEQDKADRILKEITARKESA